MDGNRTGPAGVSVGMEDNRRARARRGLALAVALVAAVSSLTVAAEAAPGDPAFTLRATANEMNGWRDRRSGTVSFFVPLWIQAPDRAFELHVGRNATTDPISASWQSESGPVALPDGSVASWADRGLVNFFEIKLRKAGVAKVLRYRRADWCPNSYERMRIAPGADDSVYPQSCGGNPFTRWQVWGIERGWAASADLYPAFKIPQGEYDLSIRVRKPYRDALGVSDAFQTIRVTVANGNPWWEKRPVPIAKSRARHAHSAARAGSSEAPAPAQTTALVENPDPSTISDLAALPAWAIRLGRQGGREHLSFAATVWNAGPAPLIVDGFRREGEAVMDAYQNFQDADGNDSGYAPVGTLEYDTQPGHEHWHFLDFARYQLIDAEEGNPILSTKEAFCLAPTDAEDMLVPGATWRPDVIGFSQCGSTDSLSIREVLPAGWGDTYYQSVPGQSFDVTDIPDGDYFIEVTANPLGRLFDASTENDRALRAITLWHDDKGRRRVSAPPYLGTL